MTDRRFDAALPVRWRRDKPLPVPYIRASTFNPVQFDRQLDEIDAVTTDMRQRIQNQAERIARVDNIFQLLVPRITHVLTVMLENHTRDVNAVAANFGEALEMIQQERDDIAARATLSMERLQAMSNMQVRFVTDIQDFINRLDDPNVANNLAALLWDDDAPVNLDQMDVEEPVNPARHFIQAWNARLVEARQEAAAFGGGRSVHDYLLLQQQRRQENREADWTALINAFALIYDVPMPNNDDAYQRIALIMQETPANALGVCPNEQLIDHPRGLIFVDSQGQCHDLVTYTEIVADQPDALELVERAESIVIGYDLLSRLLMNPGQPVPYDQRVNIDRAIIGRPRTRNRAQ